MNTSNAQPKPLKVQFVITSLPVGGAEVLLLNLIRKMDRSAFSPEVICMKDAGALGEEIRHEVPLHTNFLSSKWDFKVLPRLIERFRESQTDAVVTVGAGDKMFWGRLAAKIAKVPVICSALHSTGWPDGVGKLNRLLTPITDGFIACANSHAKHLVEVEKFPAQNVFMIPNGVDTTRFIPNDHCRVSLRRELGIPTESAVVGIVAALRSEKNHLQFVDAAQQVLRHHPDTHFVIVGEGPERENIVVRVAELGLSDYFHLLGSRSDTERLLAGMDVFCLTSRNEANPVSILEALSCGTPVVSPNVGSINETVLDRKTGILTTPLSSSETADAIQYLLKHPEAACRFGTAGRKLVCDSWSLDAMVGGYQDLLQKLYNAKSQKLGHPMRQPYALADQSAGGRHGFASETNTNEATISGDIAPGEIASGDTASGVTALGDTERLPAVPIMSDIFDTNTPSRPTEPS